VPIAPEQLDHEKQPMAHAAASGSAHATRDLDLARERSLLGTARTALAKRDGAGALAALDRHAREFADGRLAEERESLRVQALVLQGKREQAEQQADAFQKKYPTSLLKGAVRESVKPE
jgi:outer membrane protein assembly factor BamD (BamD/ComL family)